MESTSVIETSDRLSLTLCLAVIFHVMLILGIGLQGATNKKIYDKILNITLVPVYKNMENETAKILAQTNVKNTEVPKNEGYSSSVDTLRDAQLFSRQPEVEATKSIRKTIPESNTLQEPIREQRETIVESKNTELEGAKPKRHPNATQLLTRSFALAALNADLQQRLGDKANRPRRKYVSANTKEYRYAAYMEAWRAKVERIGNLNYPEKIRKKNLSGALLLDVAIKSDGSVHEILIRRSSGHKELDDAAKRIVQMAAPFSPFPDHIAEEVDILHITRTWKFLNNRGFEAP